MLASRIAAPIRMGSICWLPGTTFLANVPEKIQKIIAPSILSADFANLESEVKKVAAAGADWIHVDVMDGHFVPNLTIGAPVVKALKKISPIPLDVHLMIYNLEKYVPEFLSAGADILTIHVEATKEPERLLKEIRSAGRKAGITLKPGTSVEEIIPLLEQVDLILVMTVEPGFGGQSFRMDQVPKLKRLEKKLKLGACLFYWKLMAV